jgi:hypothetical protein
MAEFFLEVKKEFGLPHIPTMNEESDAMNKILVRCGSED